jgi:carbamoyl-phosphate synthase large subunit
MKKINALVTGVGAIIGYGIIGSLRKTNRNINIVGIDIFDDAIGSFFCDTFIQAESADSINYINFLKDVIKKHRIDIVFLGTEQEIRRVSESRSSLEDIIDMFVLNDKTVIDIFSDKLETYRYLKTNGINSIPTKADGNFVALADELGLPFLLKPRSSYASKGIVKIENEDDYQYWIKKTGENIIFQKIIGGLDHEYTASIFGTSAGVYHEPFVLRRRLSRDGSTSKGSVVKIDSLNQYIFSIAKLLPLKGPTNFQIMFHEGEYYLIEINARISSASSIRTAFGYNETELCVQYFLEKKNPVYTPTTSGRAIRFISDHIVYEDSINI